MHYFHWGENLLFAVNDFQYLIILILNWYVSYFTFSMLFLNDVTETTTTDLVVDLDFLHKPDLQILNSSLHLEYKPSNVNNNNNNDRLLLKMDNLGHFFEDFKQNTLSDNELIDPIFLNIFLILIYFCYDSTSIFNLHAFLYNSSNISFQ